MRLIIFLLITLFNSVCFSQNTNEEKHSALDSTTTFRGLNLEINIPYKNEIKSYFPGYFFNTSLLDLNLGSNSIWLATESFFNQPNYFGFSTENTVLDLLKPLRIQFEGEQELKTLKYILGMAQLGAVGYLAYKRIKKYGFK